MAARVRRARRTTTLLAAVALTLAACGAGAGSAPPAGRPAASTGPGGSPSAALQASRDVVAGALGARRVVIDQPQLAYRPAETGAFARAPRTVIQAVLPDDPTHGYIAIYEFRDPAAASAAAAEQAAYVGSPVGRVQFPTGTQFVIRVVGPTAVFYASPPDSPDDQEPDVVAALGGVGTDVPVPG